MEEKERNNWLTDYQATELTEKAAFTAPNIVESVLSALTFKEIMRQIVSSDMKDLARSISRLYGTYPEQAKINIVSNFIYERFVNDRDLYASRNNYDYYRRHGFGWQKYRTMGVVAWPHPMRPIENFEQFAFLKKVTVYAFGKIWNEFMKNPEMRLDDDMLKPLADKYFSSVVVAERANEAIDSAVDCFRDFSTIIDYVYEVYNDANVLADVLGISRDRKPPEETKQKLLDLTMEIIPVFGDTAGKNPMDVIINVLRNKDKYEEQLKMANRLFGKTVKFFFENGEKVDFESLKQIIKANIKQ